MGAQNAFLKIPMDTKKLNYDIAEANQLADEPARSVIAAGSFVSDGSPKRSLNGEEGTHAAAQSTAVIIDKAKGVLNPIFASAWFQLGRRGIESISLIGSLCKHQKTSQPSSTIPIRFRPVR